MFELVYCSTVNPNLKPEDIQNILETARNFNFKNNITGCLLYHNNEFLQILEGEKAVVQGLFALIKEDRRHSNVMLLEESEKEERMFSNWRMAFHKLHDSDLEKNNFVKDFSTFSELAKKPTHAIDLFWTIAKYILVS